MLGYIAAAGTLALIGAAVIREMVRERRSGKGGCGCGCKDCANAPYCHPQKPR